MLNCSIDAPQHGGYTSVTTWEADMNTELHRQMFTSMLDTHKTVSEKAIEAHAMWQRSAENMLQLSKFNLELARDLQQNAGKSFLDLAFPAKAV